MATFKELGLNPEIMKSLNDLGFVEPSPIQEKAIPFILGSKKDLIALAQTGTGKTAAFSLPVLNQIKAGEKDLQVIVLCPTRELCIQIARDIQKFSKYSKSISTTAVYGGERIDLQIKALRRGTNIVVGTPGRVHDLIRRKVLKLQSIKWVVLDEADEMLDMGFKEDLDSILAETPKKKQTLLFSATLSNKVYSIAKQYMNEIEEISIGTKNVGAEKVTHEYYVVKSTDRFEALKRVLDYLEDVYGILFCRTRHETQELSDKLKQANYDTEALHGEISQNRRTQIMDRFKRKKTRLLVATDVAARGIDVQDLSHVINYSLPDQSKAYTHRSGRTGRAKKSGVSVSFVNPREVRKVRELENIIGKKFEYKKIPNGEDVYKKQINNFVEEIVKIDVKKIGEKEYISESVDKLKKLKKEDLIKCFITHKFGNAINNSNAYDLNMSFKDFGSRGSNGNNVSLKINLGRNHGFTVKDLLGLINSNSNFKNVEVGKIDLMPEHSVFCIDKQHHNNVVEHFKGINFGGNKIDLSVVENHEAPYPRRRRRSRPGWSGNRRRGNTRRGR